MSVISRRELLQIAAGVAAAGATRAPERSASLSFETQELGGAQKAQARPVAVAYCTSGGIPVAPRVAASVRPRTLRQVEPLNWAPCSLAEVKSVSMKIESRRSALDKSAPERSAPEKSTLTSFAPTSLARGRWAKLKSARDTSAPERSASSSVAELNRAFMRPID